ncbi:MAG: hypothetical protein V2J55_17840 [Candidatus Competibacteraceae bacterium]|jgi:hypothetical protein|nr:hypothetical protein [Candidatus Competibacteraceae bacterium]
MAIQHDPGLQIYVSKSDIPSYQRDWVWGAAVLFVFICGLLTTWLLTPNLASVQPTAGIAEDALARQETVNQQLQTQIARLETLLASKEFCNADTVTAVQKVLDNATDP